MSAFCVPTPCIIPLKIPTFGELKHIDSTTRIEILCETELGDIEMFYTVDGTKPQPYVGIVQGSKTHKYTKPFCLTTGKVTVKAMAIHPRFPSMCSNVITKTFHVEEVRKQSLKTRRTNREGLKSDTCEESAASMSKDEDEIGHPASETATSDVNEDVDNGEMESDLNAAEEVTTDTSHIADNDYHDDDDDKDSDGNTVEPDLIDFNIPDEVESADDATATTEFEEPTADVNSDLNNQPEPDESAVSDALDEISVATKSTSPQHVAREMPLQHCPSCKKINSMLSKYCDECGEKLYKICSSCHEQNPSIAKFCQFCGENVRQNGGDSIQADTKQLRSIGVLAKPVLDNKSAGSVPTTLINRSVQTLSACGKKAKPTAIRKLPASTPGRGYWRQQLDYICNHLKVHSNNNLEFQKIIGAPALGRFISADCVESDGSVSIHITFESLPRAANAHP